MVKAVRIREPGGPEAMRLEDVELPPPGRGEALVRNHAIGVNFIDVYFRKGEYPAQTPFTLGHEAAGEVVEVGKGVKDVKVGDRVAYIATLGAYAEARIVDADRLVKLPKGISYETAAGMLLKGLTAQYLLRRTYRVKKGDTILVQAAAGGVGLLLCQWGKALGAHVIGTAGSALKAERARDAGARHVIAYREEDFVARVKEITKGRLCDVVYDGVGAATFPASLDCLRPLGLFVSFGSASGPIEAFNMGLLSAKGSLFATRPSLFTYIAKKKDLRRAAEDLFDIVSTGDVTISVEGAYPLADAANVHRALEARETTGSLILIP